MSSLAAIAFGAPEALWLAVAIFAAALAFLAWSYRRSDAPTGVRLAAFFLKLLAVAALLLCLLEPIWTSQRARPGANQLAIVADNSLGLQVKDAGATETRGESLRKLVTGPGSGWLGDLENTFQVRRYTFDSRLQASRDFSELRFDGRASGLAGALRSIAERSKGQPVAGVVLLTDGIATDLPDGLPDLTGLPPIYPVVIGRDDALRDVAIAKSTVSQTVFEDAPVTVQAEVGAPGYGNAPIVAEIFDEKGKSVKQLVQSVSDGETTTFRFELKPEKPGISFYELRVRPESEKSALTNAALSTEATLANNRRTLVVDRGAGPYRILYVAGRPNWEFKFLNRALAEDPQVHLVGLIRIAKREPKFDFRGRAGEGVNPLFKGFDKTNEETERYDQPVLTRFNTRDEAELRGGFPRTAEELYGYQAVIIDDLESGFFTRDQMSLLQKFASERGGGVMMLGGQESFAEGGYDRTPIGDMLPVYLNRPVDYPKEPEFKFDLSHEGMLQPWMRLRSEEGAEKERLGSMPKFLVANLVGGVRPGASVLASVTDERGKAMPAVVTQRFGNGRIGAVLIGDVFRWGMKDEASHKDMDKGWRQLIRWLVADVPAFVTLEAAPRSADSGTELTVRARDKKFEAVDNATVTIEVRQAGSTNPPIRFTAEPSSTEAGVYLSSFQPRDTGGYIARAVVTDSAGVELGKAEAGWTSDPVAEEFRTLKPNRALLETIARQTGGEVVSADLLAAFAKKLPNKRAPVSETSSEPLWHTPLLFLFALSCFVAEWALRRWKGLA